MFQKITLIFIMTIFSNILLASNDLVGCRGGVPKIEVGNLAELAITSENIKNKDALFTADIHQIEGKPIAKRGRLPGITDNPRLERLL